MSVVRRRINAAVGTVIGVAVAAAVVVVIKAETAEAGHETPAATEMPIVVEAAACLGKVLTRKTATDGGPSTAEMAPAKAAAHASAAAKAAHASAAAKATHASAAAEAAHASAAAEAAHVSAAAEPAAHMSATGETAAVSTADTPAVSASTSSAARKRVSGQSCGERGSRSQDDHSLP